MVGVEVSRRGSRGVRRENVRENVQRMKSVVVASRVSIFRLFVCLFVCLFHADIVLLALKE